MHLAQGLLNFGANYISNIPAQSPQPHFFLSLSLTLIFFGLLSVSVYFCAKCRKKKEAADQEKAAAAAPEKATASAAANKTAAAQSGAAAVGAVKNEPTAPARLSDKAPPTETLLIKRDGTKSAKMKSGTAAAGAPILEFKKAAATPKAIPLYMETLPETETATVVKKSARTAPQKQTPQYVESNELDAVKAAAAVPAGGAPAYIEVGPKDAAPGQPHYIAESEIPKFKKTRAASTMGLKMKSALPVPPAGCTVPLTAPPPPSHRMPSLPPMAPAGDEVGFKIYSASLIKKATSSKNVVVPKTIETKKTKITTTTTSKFMERKSKKSRKSQRGVGAAAAPPPPPPAAKVPAAQADYQTLFAIKSGAMKASLKHEV